MGYADLPYKTGRMIIQSLMDSKLAISLFSPLIKIFSIPFSTTHFFFLIQWENIVTFPVQLFFACFIWASTIIGKYDSLKRDVVLKYKKNDCRKVIIIGRRRRREGEKGVEEEKEEEEGEGEEEKNT